MRKLCALLRAVNVGGRKLAMADLKALLAAEGFAEPQTLLASGNAVFGSDLPAPAAEARLEAALAAMGLPTAVLVRDAAGLAAVVAANPFAAMAAEHPSRLAVCFLRGEPVAHLSVLAAYCGQGEAVAAGPGCLYLTYPAGIATSKLMLTVIERKLGVKGTARNWNTVGKLADRLGA